MAKTDRPDGGTDLLERPATKPKTERPPLYKVLLLNDNVTPFNVVVEVLRRVFNMGPEKAFQVMMTAHEKGSCLCGVFTFEVAETKVMEGKAAGREYGTNLQFDLEPEE